MDMDKNQTFSRCYLYDAAKPEAWGDCCADLSIIPKPVWVVLLLSVPIEAVLAAADVKADAGMYEKKSNQTAAVFLLYNFVTLGLLAYQFDWGSCEASGKGVWECYQGLLFMFYNSTAALASMTLWMLIIMRKYYPQLYFLTRLIISPRQLWIWFDKLNLKGGGTHATVERWHMISASTKLFWYNRIGIVVTLIFGGITHIIPMFFAFPYVLVSMVVALVYAHSLRLGYTSLSGATNLKSTVLNILLFYPVSLALSGLFLALSPLSLMVKASGCHSMDNEDRLDLEGLKGTDDSLQIFLRTEGGVIITLNVEQTDSVASLIPKAKQNLGLAFDKKTLHFIFNNEMMDESENIPLSRYGLSSGDTLDLVVEPEKIVITIKLEDGTIQEVKIGRDATIGELLQALAKRQRLHPDAFWLLLDGRQIHHESSRKLSEIGVSAGTELELLEKEILLHVELSNGTSAEVRILRDAAYQDLLRQVAELEGIPSDDIELLVDGERLDPENNLHDQGISSRSSIVSISSQPRSSSKIAGPTSKRKPEFYAARPRPPSDAGLDRLQSLVQDDYKKKRPASERLKEKAKSPERFKAETRDAKFDKAKFIEEGDDFFSDVDEDKNFAKFAEEDVEEGRKKRERREQARREKRRRIRGYIKDVLRNLCMFDPNGKVIMFAAATTFLCFTFAANYGLLLYSGAPYLEVIRLDWNSRSSLTWFSCTADNFVNVNAFGLVDFLGLAIGTAAALFELMEFLVTI